MIPFVPIIEEGEVPWAMFQDLWARHDWVFEPLVYSSVDELIPKLRNSVVKPALKRRKMLLTRRAEKMGTRLLDEFDLDQE